MFRLLALNTLLISCFVFSICFGLALQTAKPSSRIADDRGGVVFCCVSLGRFLQQVGQETCVMSYHQCEVIRDGSCQPRELYGSLIETFSKDRVLIIDIGNAFNGNRMLAAVRLKIRLSVLINEQNHRRHKVAPP
ncbi:PREDICTED: uncharacterized protein LOC107334266 [Acropora digitifera]|uniref:uncharacterized protein LOC107334266 n=1 Tax=Acropora digitifera TaxID=70779 RepID=UPI00077B0F90|nr:PREDICTED: uncharacterized protein LOC107334266 [Acropora digitifera]